MTDYVSSGTLNSTNSTLRKIVKILTITRDDKLITLITERFGIVA